MSKQRFVAVGICFFALLLALFGSRSDGQRLRTNNQDFLLAGTTSKMIGNDYNPMPRVQFSVLRNGPVFARPKESDGNGLFSEGVPAGTPVTVLFIGPDGYLPELQALSGESGKEHQVHVTLLTIDQAKELKIDVFRHLGSIAEYLTAHGVSEEDELFKRIDEMKRRAG